VRKKVARNTNEYNKAKDLSLEDQDLENMHESREEVEAVDSDETPDLTQCFGQELFDIGDYE